MNLQETVIAKNVIDSLKNHIVIRKELLSAEEQIVRKYILNFYYEHSRFPLFIEISDELSITMQNLNVAIGNLDKYDAIKLDHSGCRILLAYPFCEDITDYKICVEKEVNKPRCYYANCAIDSLGIPFMFKCDANISAKTAFFKNKIEISVIDQDTAISNPKDVIVFASANYCSKSADSVCSSLVFFSGMDEFNLWKRDQGVAEAGEILSLNEALYVSKILFQNRLNDKEV